MQKNIQLCTHVAPGAANKAFTVVTIFFATATCFAVAKNMFLAQFKGPATKYLAKMHLTWEDALPAFELLDTPAEFLEALGIGCGGVIGDVSCYVGALSAFCCT